MIIILIILNYQYLILLNYNKKGTNQMKKSIKKVTFTNPLVAQFIRYIFNHSTAQGFTNAVESEHAQCYISNGKLVIL